MQSVESAQR